jgi:hypothetical protein
MARASALRVRSAGLVERAVDAQVAARRLRDASVGHQRTHGRDTSFVVWGFVDHMPVVARWGRRRGLDCPAELLRRARAVVGLGETFGGEDGSTPVAASLDAGPTAALLTVIRAMSGVTAVDLDTGRMEVGAPRRR